MGVPWILDVLSAGLSYQFGAKTFTLRVVLDILNLMTVSYSNIVLQFLSFKYLGNSDILITDL